MVLPEGGYLYFLGTPWSAGSTFVYSIYHWYVWISLKCVFLRRRPHPSGFVVVAVAYLSQPGRAGLLPIRSYKWLRSKVQKHAIPGCAAPGWIARSRRSDGGDMAQLGIKSEYIRCIRVASLLLHICSPNSGEQFSCLMFSCWLPLPASRAPSPFCGQAFSWLYLALLDHRRLVAWLCMLYKDYDNSVHCLYGQQPAASKSVRHTPAAVTAQRYVLDVLRCRTSQFARYFLSAYVRTLNGLPAAVFESGSLGMASRKLSSVGCSPELAFIFSAV